MLVNAPAREGRGNPMTNHFDLVQYEILSESRDAQSLWRPKKTLLLAIISSAIAWATLILLVRQLLRLI